MPYLILRLSFSLYGYPILDFSWIYFAMKSLYSKLQLPGYVGTVFKCGFSVQTYKQSTRTGKEAMKTKGDSLHGHICHAQSSGSALFAMKMKRQMIKVQKADSEIKKRS
jgi:hypothetical protein